MFVASIASVMGLPARSHPEPSSIALVFPGQGSQRAGMGSDFYDELATARDAYSEASDAVGIDLRRLCFDEDARLSLTEYAQPAIVTTEVAMARGLAERWGVTPNVLGGHSLGEYAALVVAQALPLGAAVRAVRERGRLMQAAAPVGTGRMTAIIGRDLDRRAIAVRLEALDVRVANDNSAEQIVLSGAATDMDRAIAIVEQVAGDVRVVDLDVSAPFHSHLMATVEADFAAPLDEALTQLDPARARSVTSNLTGDFHTADRGAVHSALLRQISATVRWRDNMRRIAENAATVIEVGPGRPLRAFFKSEGVEVRSISSLTHARRAFAEA